MSRQRKQSVTTGHKAANPGTKAGITERLARIVESPDVPMVLDRVDNPLARSEAGQVSVFKMYEDGGHKIRVMNEVRRRAEIANLPRTPEGIYESLESLFTFCGERYFPVTLGLFALWNGVTMQRMWQIERDKADPRSEAIGVCKEIIRSFLEVATYEGTLSPIVFFNAMKSQYGLPENQQVTVTLEDNTRELSASELQERALQLIDMEPGEDGVYRAVED